VGEGNDMRYVGPRTKTKKERDEIGGHGGGSRGGWFLVEVRHQMRPTRRPPRRSAYLRLPPGISHQ
jgi:hypothetical protein